MGDPIVGVETMEDLPALVCVPSPGIPWQQMSSVIKGSITLQMEKIMAFRNFNFTNSDSEKLSAPIDFPSDEKPVAYALFAHCFTCTKNFKAVNQISKALTREGIAVLRFDFTGLGESEGDFSDTNFSSNISDLVSAAKYLEAN